MIFTDTHVHLHFPEYAEDREQVLKRAQDAGVGLFVNVGTDLATSLASLQLAEQYSHVYATAGIHPHDAESAYSQFEEIAALAEHPRMVAIGEVGLDFFRNHSPQEKQIALLRRFIQLYFRISKPLIIHCRDAYEEFLSILETESSAPYRGVMHCYSSDREMMFRLLDKGFMISFAGPLTYKKNDALREACKACPLDRILLETDAPFLPPQSMRGKRNESAHLIETASVAAQLHGLTLSELAEKTTENARKLFAL